MTLQKLEKLFAAYTFTGRDSPERFSKGEEDDLYGIVFHHVRRVENLNPYTWSTKLKNITDLPKNEKKISAQKSSENI